MKTYDLPPRSRTVLVRRQVLGLTAGGGLTILKREEPVLVRLAFPRTAIAVTGEVRTCVALVADDGSLWVPPVANSSTRDGFVCLGAATARIATGELEAPAAYLHTVFNVFDTSSISRREIDESPNITNFREMNEAFERWRGGDASASLFKRVQWPAYFDWVASSSPT